YGGCSQITWTPERAAARSIAAIFCTSTWLLAGWSMDAQPAAATATARHGTRYFMAPPTWGQGALTLRLHLGPVKRPDQRLMRLFSRPPSWPAPSRPAARTRS